MAFVSLVIALLLEHVHPLRQRVGLYVQFTRYVNFLERHLNAGRYRYGVLGWLLAVLPPVVAVELLAEAVRHGGLLLSLAFDVAVLYLTAGLRHFTDRAGRIGQALREGDVDTARRELSQWHGLTTDGLDANALTRLTIEQLFSCAHRQFFGVVFWFLLLGPAGAVLYRLAHGVYQKWGLLNPEEFGRFGLFAADAFRWLDWIPARLLALSFAVVGNFEDALYCWREQAANWAQRMQGMVLAAGAGALGVRLGEPLAYPGRLEVRPELGVGAMAAPEHVEGAVALVWRAVVAWLAVLLLLALATAAVH